MRGVRKCDKNSPGGTKVKEEGGENVLQAVDQVPLPFMEDCTRPSIPTAAYRESHSVSLASQEIRKSGNFTHYRLSNQKESSLS